MDELEDFIVDDTAEENIGVSESELDDMESQAGTKVKKLKDELEICKKEKQEYLDGWQRSKADFVNVLRRSEEEKKSAKDQGVVRAVEELLPVLDALERSKAHGDIPEGFQGIAKQLESAFISLGLTSVGKVGEPFDPNLHEALGQDSAKSESEDDTVTAILEIGYKLGDRVVRPAKVRVAHFK